MDVHKRRVGSIVKRQAYTVAPCDALVGAARHMTSQGLPMVVVLEGDKPVGLLSSNDLVRAIAFELPVASLTVGELMKSPVPTIEENVSVGAALTTVRAVGLPQIPVVDHQGHLLGTVGETDLLEAESQVLHQRGQQLDAVLAESRFLRATNSRLQALSMEDPLMGVGNRRAMEQELTKLASGARRYSRRYSVLLFDVDHFKKYNDRYGHQPGDEVLRQIAKALKETIRQCDTVFRYGGEELLIVAPETGLKGAMILGQRCNLAIESLAMVHEDSPYGVVTITGGVACRDLDDQREWEDLVRDADEALYKAKAYGRNRVLPSRAFDPSSDGDIVAKTNLETKDY